MKLALIAALIGHIICGVTDCLLAYTPGGRFDFKDVSDGEKMKRLFEKMSLRQIEASMLLGALALFMAAFGYLSLSGWAKGYSEAAGTVMYISALFFIVPITAHHVLCGAVEWFYVKLGRTDKVLEDVVCFFKRTAAAAAAYVGLPVFAVTLFILVVSGKTDLPRWCCIFNTLTFFALMAPTKIPAQGNIANALMFLGLSIAI